MSMFRSLVLTVLCLACGSAGAAGVQFIEVSVGDGSGLKGAVWSPCAKQPGKVMLRGVEASGVMDCPIDGERLPLVVISHGGRGWFGGHHDTAAALADAGYIVAAITHPEAEYWRFSRPQAVRGLIDHLLSNWTNKDKIDDERIGFFGFSRGGYTGLVLIGGVPDFSRVGRHCQAASTDPVCRPNGRETAAVVGVAPSSHTYVHDQRIKAAVLAAPLGLVFSPEALNDITVPIQLWRPENDELATHPYNAEHVYQARPAGTDYRVISGAGHFVILAPCTEAQAQAAPRTCNDADGFDRAAFHREFNAEVVSFFDGHLREREAAN